VAHPHLASTLARFDARIHRTKNRLLAVPRDIQRKLGLGRRPENDILLVSIRKAHSGRWNHHYVKLTYDNEFALPSDIAHVQPGDDVEVKIHEVYSVTPKPRGDPLPAGAGLLVALASDARPGWREDGSTRVDDYLSEEIRDNGRIR
jgi:hypothetical protein